MVKPDSRGSFTYRGTDMLTVYETHSLHLPFKRFSDRAQRLVFMVVDDFGNFVQSDRGQLVHALLT